MKKYLFSAIAILTLGVASQAQVKVGVTAGGQLSNQRINVEGKNLYAGQHFKGYNAGLTADIKLSEHFYLQPQLLYSRKGATLLSSAGDADTKVKMSYVEVPVSILYKFDLPFGKLFGGAGAAFSYGMGGSLDQGGQKSPLYGESSDWKRKDLSMRLTGGIEFNNGLFASIHSQRSLLNVSRMEGVAIKNESLNVSVGYLINLSK